MNFFKQGENYLEYKNAGETLRIIAWGENSLRIVSVPFGELDLSCTALIEQESSAETTIKITEETAVITNGKITAVMDACGKNSAAVIAFYNDRGELLLKEIDGGGNLLRKARAFKPHVGGDYQLKATFVPEEGEKLYGMGQYQQPFLDLKGCNLELAQRNTQVTIPFYISSKGYGFFWHNPAIGSVSFGKNTTEWRADYTKKLDYWITAEDTPEKILEQYTAVTGRVPVMPEYGLGFWQCKLRYHNQEEVLKIAREYHRRGIPVNVFVIDYYHWPRLGDFRFDEHDFPDPAAMVDELHSYGMEVMVSVWPETDWRSENFAQACQQGLLVKTERGVNVQMHFVGNNIFFDTTNPAAREFMWKKCHENYGKYGIRLYWLDVAEPEYGTADFDNYRYHAGSVAQMGNLYPREYVKGFAEGEIREHGECSVNLIRSAWAGSQRFGALAWSGDIHSTYESFRNQIVSGLQMGLSGIPWWTTDIGGFHGGNIYDEDFKELLIRWFQFGTFCPVMRLHGCREPKTPLYLHSGEETEGTGAANEIWAFGEETYGIMKKFIDIRELLRDYTRELMRAAHEKGSPVIRPMFYEFPDDKETWDLQTQYMYGPDILAAPVAEKGCVKRSVYLPKGCLWTDARSGEQFTGGKWIDAEAPIHTLPIFLREGRPAELIGKI